MSGNVRAVFAYLSTFILVAFSCFFSMHVSAQECIQTGDFVLIPGNQSHQKSLKSCICVVGGIKTIGGDGGVSLDDDDDDDVHTKLSYTPFWPKRVQ